MSGFFNQLQNKLLLLAMLPVLVITSVLTVYMVTTRITDIEVLLQEKATAVAEQIAADNVNTIFTRNKQQLISKTDGYFSSYNNLVEAKIYSSDKIFSHSLAAKRGTAADLVFASSDIRLGVSTYSLDDYDFYDIDANVGSSIIGHVEIWMVDNSQQQKSEIIISSIVIMLTMLAITALAVIPMSRKLIVPINKLANAFRSLAKGYYHTRVAEDSKDELLTLQHGFNQMSEALEHHNEDMNEQVNRMTHDLQTTMEALEIQNVELDIARRQAIESSRIKSEFLANMSHEIRTPMNGIVGFTGLLQKTPLDDLQEQYLQTIDHSAKSLLQILNDILDLSKIEAGKIEINRQGFVLEDCISDVISIFTPLAHDKKLNLIPLVYNDLPRTVIGDRNRIIQLLSNLLSNAIKFTNEGDVILRVMLDACDKDNLVISFSVTDTGIGIPVSKQDLLFKPFTQISSNLNRGFGGTGLGLSISKSLVELMGGEINFESKAGEGSTFTITLPLILGENDFVPDERLAQFSNLNLLLLDLHKLSSASLSNVFSRLGFNVERRGSFTINTISSEDLESYSLLVISTTEFDLENLDDAAKLRFRELKIPRLILLSTSDQDILQKYAKEFHCMVLKKPVFIDQIKGHLKTLLSDGKEATHDNGKERILPEEILINKNLLVVDDNEINQQLMSALLEDLGAKVTVVNNGYESVELVAENDFDIVFMDIHMPALNGIEAASLIRQKNSKVPIIALTADIAFRESGKVNQYGFNDVLIKPIESIHLYQVISKVLRSDIKLESSALRSDAEQSIDKLATRDLEQALRITGGQKVVADKLLTKLVQQLPDYLESVVNKYKDKDWPQLWQVLHKLHGATAVCGVPELNHVVINLQKHITNADYLLISDEIDKLRIAAGKLIDYAASLDDLSKV